MKERAHRRLQRRLLFITATVSVRVCSTLIIPKVIVQRNSNGALLYCRRAGSDTRPDRPSHRTEAKSPAPRQIRIASCKPGTRAVIQAFLASAVAVLM